MRRMTVLSVAVMAAAAGGATAQTANFDTQTEGFLGTSFVENGLTFHDGDPRIPGSPPPTSLNAEDASSTLAGFAGFSPPNTLAMIGFSPGPGAAFSRFGSLSITPDTPGTHASIDVFDFFSEPANSINFAAYLNGQQVDIMTVPIAGGGSINHYHLEVNGEFDDLKIFGSGPADQGVFFGLIDNVIVTMGGGACYANCDQSTTEPILNVNDFICFQSKFAAGDSYANCDNSTTEPVLNVNDFICFQAKFAEGCS
jgi:hypothetical protein